MTRRASSPLGHVIGPLLRGKLSVRTVLDRHFGEGALRARVLRALTSRDLATATIISSRARPLETRCARRMLALVLMLVERLDAHGVACGSAIWQGSLARRLGLSTRHARAGGPLGGIREVQRYVSILEASGALKAHQPDAARVTDAMRARPRLSIVRGASVVRRWSYNVIRFVGVLPRQLSQLAHKQRTRPADHTRLEAAARSRLEGALRAATTQLEAMQATLTYLRDRPRVPI